MYGGRRDRSRATPTDPRLVRAMEQELQDVFGTDDDGDSVSSTDSSVSSHSGSGEDGQSEDSWPVMQKQFRDLLGAVKKSFDKIESV